MKSALCQLLRLVPVAILAAATGGCSSIYYGAMEKFGWEKRDILVKRVTEARDAQGQAKEQFKSALEQFSSVVAVDGGELEAKYSKLSAEFERSEARAAAVSERIRAVEQVSKALFKEWRAELDQYTSASLRQSSRETLELTESRYKQYIAAMQRAEKKMAPVLNAFRDQVLFLKHNLNARAVASLQAELRSVENSTTALLRDMEASITEANSFISTLEKN